MATKRNVPRAQSRSKSGAKSSPTSTLRSIKAAAPVAEQVVKFTPSQAKALGNQVLDEALRIESENEVHRRKQVAREAHASQVLPITLRDVSRAIGVDCDPEQFAATALMEISRQADALADLATEGTDGGYNNWKLIRNLSDRAALAGRVTAWLEQGKPEALPEVEP